MEPEYRELSCCGAARTQVTQQGLHLTLTPATAWASSAVRSEDAASRPDLPVWILELL